MNRIELLNDLRTGFSNQAKQANNHWLILMFLSIVSLLNLNLTPNTVEDISLPFTLGKVPPAYFCFLMLRG